AGSGRDRNRTALEASTGLKYPPAGRPSGRTAYFANVFVRRFCHDEPWNNGTYGNLVVASARVGLRFGLRHPPPSAVTLAVIGVEIDAPECLPRRLPIFRQAARLNSLTVSAKELRFEVHCVSFRPTRVRNESATIWTATFG